MGEIKFGFRPYIDAFTTRDIEVRALDDLGAKVTAYRSSGQIFDRWYELPFEHPSGLKGKFSTSDRAPMVPVRRLELAPSHLLIHAGTNSIPRLRFLVLSIGFLSGMTILPEGFGHLSRFPAERGVHGDFYGTQNEISTHINCFDRFYVNNSANAAALISSAIVHIQRSSSSGNFWDRYLFIYTAFDAIAATFREINQNWTRRSKHGTLPRDICRYFQMPIPPGAKTYPIKRGGKSPPLACRFSMLRNALFHEGRYYNRPAGEIAKLDMHEATIDLKNLCHRLILALVGAKTSYIKTKVASRQMFSIVDP